MIQKFNSWAYTPKDENSNSKRHMHRNVQGSTVYKSQDLETTEVSMDR